ncbi:MAG: hypothetical protein ACKPJJ_14640, partial [Planctomycetaceae bacterium]
VDSAPGQQQSAGQLQQNDDSPMQPSGCDADCLFSCVVLNEGAGHVEVPSNRRGLFEEKLVRENRQCGVVMRKAWRKWGLQGR